MDDRSFVMQIAQAFPRTIATEAADGLEAPPEQIVELARYLRDHLRFEMLVSITAVDYIEHDQIELVYHFARLDGGVLSISARVPRAAPKLPALTPFWPGADFQEREAYDLYGVVFEGHPNLRRIYMWDEFEGFPMRKDYPKQGDKYFVNGGSEQ